MSSILKYSTIVFYAVTFVVLLWRSHRPANSQITDKRGLMLLTWAAACILHALHLYPQTFTSQGLNLTFYNTVSLVLFIISTLVLVLSVNKKREFIGLFLLPIVVAGIALTILKPEIQVATSNARGLQFHIVFSLFSFSVLTISAIQSILLFNQERHLRKAEIDDMTRALPPLYDSEKFLFQTITIGFILLSIALITGFIFLENMFQQHIAHKTILSILAWVLFAILLWGRWKFGWRGQMAVRWTLGGFAFLILAYLGSKFVQEIVLHRVADIPLS
ncbi:MAG: cytochrome c biogenesis protein CcsA [Gammaproteobacteria bacterium]|nr:cytochrome c biogenesis protein CcsA [Gammaproteobacteria bacterium]